MKKILDFPVLSSRGSKQESFDALVRTFSTDLYRYAYWLCKDKAVAEDLVQETFMRAWKGIDSLKEVKAAKSWLITILRRENARRFEKFQPELVDIADQPLADDSEQPEQELERNDLHKAIADLEEEYREPMVLQTIFGYSGQEIAEVLELNANTVSTRLHRAKKVLQQKLRKS